MRSSITLRSVTRLWLTNCRRSASAAKHNAGLAALRLRDLAKQHAEFRELLPPEDLEVNKLRRFAEDEIESRFERVPGVSQSQVFGGWEDELQVVVDPEKLAARRITLTQVRNVLRGQNEDTSAGDFWEGKRRWVVRALGQFRTPEQVENQLLAVRDGAPVFVRDVAEVRLGYKKPAAVVRRFGESSIAVNAARASGVNELEVMAGLREAVVELNEQILRPRGLELTQVYDETDYIYSAIDLVNNNIFVGGALTMIVLMLFLHPETRTFLMMPFIVATAVAASFISPWFFVICLGLIIAAGFWFARAALVVGLAIPISIIGTFVMLNVLGSTLNVISLAGLAFAVGMFIDNAIVVLENIYRRHSLGESPMTAAVRGTQEVFGAVVASSLDEHGRIPAGDLRPGRSRSIVPRHRAGNHGGPVPVDLRGNDRDPHGHVPLVSRHTKLDPPDEESKPRMRIVNPSKW